MEDETNALFCHSDIVSVLGPPDTCVSLVYKNADHVVCEITIWESLMIENVLPSAMLVLLNTNS